MAGVGIRQQWFSTKRKNTGFIKHNKTKPQTNNKKKFVRTVPFSTRGTEHFEDTPLDRCLKSALLHLSNKQGAPD